MAFPDATWTRIGGLNIHIQHNTADRVEVRWNICHYLCECSVRRARGIRGGNYMDVKSNVFAFAEAVWNFYASFDLHHTHSLFGINVRTHTIGSFEVRHCCFSISFVNVRGEAIKDMEYEHQFIFQRNGYHWAVTDFLTSYELKQFLQRGEKIICTIRIKNPCLEIEQLLENTHSSGSSSVEAHVQNQLPEKMDEELPMPDFDYTVLQDFRNLLLTEVGSDLIIHVKDKQFKAHRAILIARSKVFAAMFGHDMKEKATGIVNVEDCESSSFPVFLDYLYCGSTEKLSPENVFDLYVAAEKYDVQDLKKKCLEFMKSKLTVDTFCETLRIALQYSDTENLLNLVTEFFIKYFELIQLTTKWKTFLLENPDQSNELLKKYASKAGRRDILVKAF